MLRRTSLPRRSSILCPSPLSRFGGSFFSKLTGGSGGAASSSDSGASPSSDSCFGADLFEHWETAQLQRHDAGMRDPVCRALVLSGAYVDPRVAWLPYKDEVLARRSKTDGASTLGVPVRTSCITAIEPISAGVMVACVPLDLCVSPGFVHQTPSLSKCFENVKPEYSCTVGESTFALNHEAVCSIVLLSFAVTTEGPLQDYFTTVMDVENTEARWQLLDIFSSCDVGDEADAVSAIGREQPPLNEYMRQLCGALPKDNDTWAFFANLCAARTRCVRQLYDDMYQNKDSVFFNGCSFEDFCSCVAVFQSRSAPIPEPLQDSLLCEVGVIPFFDCADHMPQDPEEEAEQQQQQHHHSDDTNSGGPAVGHVNSPADMLSLKYYRAENRLPQQDRGPLAGALAQRTESLPFFVPQSCREKPSIGIFTTQDVEVGQPITRCFGSESRRMPSEDNLFWIMNHSCVPWDVTFASKQK